MAEVSGRPLSITTSSEVHRGRLAGPAGQDRPRPRPTACPSGARSPPVRSACSWASRAALHPLVASPTYQATGGAGAGRAGGPAARPRGPGHGARRADERRPASSGPTTGSSRSATRRSTTPAPSAASRPSPPGRAGRRSTWLSTSCWSGTAGACSTCPSPTTPTGTSPPSGRCSCTPHRPGLGDAGAHCGMICDGSMPDLPGQPLGPGRGRAAPAGVAGEPADPGRRRPSSACTTAACWPPATGPT